MSISTVCALIIAMTYANIVGGGWTFGGLTGDAEICNDIKDRLGILVVDVDYRLSPENAFGTGTDDAWAAIRWVSCPADL